MSTNLLAEAKKFESSAKYINMQVLLFFTMFSRSLLGITLKLALVEM
jgi:hypothetical protein